MFRLFYDDPHSPFSWENPQAYPVYLTNDDVPPASLMKFPCDGPNLL